jgi:DNA invertase Pin-like site-specific DNA recombinase
VGGVANNAALSPARNNLDFDSSVRARAMMTRSGRNARRCPRKGDTVVVWKLDRLGRNMIHILRTVKELTDRGVRLLSTTDGIDSSTAAGRMMIGVLGSLAEYERELTRESTALQRATARARGATFGRPRKVVDAEHIATARRMKADGHTARDIAKYLGVGRATLYRYLGA